MKPEDVLAIARAEVGYCGKRSNSDLYNPTGNQLGLFTKYAQELWDTNPNYYNFCKNGYNYCTVFADWCFWKAAGENKEEATKVKPYNILNAGVSWTYKAFDDVGRIGNYPQVGACIFFKDSKGEIAHIGLVEEVTDTGITTIEGNVGKKVVRKSYKLNDASIHSYGYPFYEEPEPEPTPEPEPEEWKTIAEWAGLEGNIYRLQEKK